MYIDKKISLKLVIFMKSVFYQLRIWLSILGLGAAMLLQACAPTQTVQSASLGTAAAIQKLTAGQVKEVVQQNKDIIVLDVRTPEEFKEGHLARAVNINYLSDNFTEQVEQLDKSKTYLLYCKSGTRSSKAGSLMLTKGFGSLLDSVAGFETLKETGLPVEDNKAKFR
jgi:phage shock protein E